VLEEQFPPHDIDSEKSLVGALLIMSVIYETTGRTREYSELAVNREFTDGKD
jgi:hypothetical protein